MAYTDLIKIERPLGTALSPIASLNAKASAGDTVEIYVYIKNQHSTTIGVKPRAIINGTIEVVFTVPYADIPAGFTYYFTGHFTMPSIDANIRAESYYYGVDGQWHFEDYQTRTINLAAVAEVLTGLRSTSVNVVYSTYDFGATVPYVLGYDYKGEAQGGTLKIEIGTGMYPYFTLVAVVGPVSYNFTEKADYTRVTENRTFVLPSTLTRGQAYSVRVILTTADGLTDNDIDYNALKVLDVIVPSTDLQGLAVNTSYRDYALGEVLSFSLTFKYKGIAQSGKLQVAIKKGLATVYTYNELTVQYIESAALSTVTWSREVTLPETLSPGQVYGLYARLTTLDGRDTSNTRGTAFKIAEAEVPEDPGVGDYREVKNYVYPYAESYRGAASKATVEITVPLAQLPGGDWISQQIVDEFEGQVAEHGSHMLGLVVYERDNGLTSKDYKLIAIATPPKETAGQEYTSQGIVDLVYAEPSGLPVAVWAIIVLGVLLAIGFIISAVVPDVREGVWGEGGFVDTVTDIGGILGDLLPMMMIMVMMALMMEQTRGLYEPGLGQKEVASRRTEAMAAQSDWNKARALVASKKVELRRADEAHKGEKQSELTYAEERETESHEAFDRAKSELDKARVEQTRLAKEAALAPPRPKPVTEAAVKVGKKVFELGRKAAPHVVEAAKKAVEAAEGTVKYLTKQVQEATAAIREAQQADKVFYEEREAESKRKLQEAKVELKKRREEQAKKAGQ